MSKEVKFNGKFTYDVKYKNSELQQLATYLLGKPDTEGWREIFARNKAVPVGHNGKIFPEWAIKDARILLRTDPDSLIQWLAAYNLTLDDIPV